MKPNVPFTLAAAAALVVTSAIGSGADAAAPQPMTVITPAQATALPATANRAVPGNAIAGAMARGETGIFRAATVRLNGQPTIETIAVLDGGRVIDLHARKGGVFMVRRSNAGLRGLSSAKYTALLACGLDRPMTTVAQRTQFMRTVNAAAATPSGPTGPATPSCPGDFAAAPPELQAKMLKMPAYAGCSFTYLHRPAPGAFGQGSAQWATRIAARALTELVGIPAARAADWSLIFFEVSVSAFTNFSSWGFESVSGEYFAMNIGGLRAVWANTGG